MFEANHEIVIFCLACAFPEVGQESPAHGEQTRDRFQESHVPVVPHTVETVRVDHIRQLRPSEIRVTAAAMGVFCRVHEHAYRLTPANRGANLPNDVMLRDMLHETCK